MGVGHEFRDEYWSCLKVNLGKLALGIYFPFSFYFVDYFICYYFYLYYFWGGGGEVSSTEGAE